MHIETHNYKWSTHFCSYSLAIQYILYITNEVCIAHDTLHIILFIPYFFHHICCSNTSAFLSKHIITPIYTVLFGYNFVIFKMQIYI